MRQARLLVTALYALAMASVGLAHNRLAFDLERNAVVYALPDGSVPPICLDDETSPGSSRKAGNASCDACLLTSGPGLPAGQAASALLAPEPDATARPPERDDSVTAPAFRLPQPRGPPDTALRA